MNANIQQLLAHLENLPIACIEWDCELRVQYWSKRAEELFGWTAEEVVGRHPLDWPFIHEDDRERIDRLMTDICAGRLAQATEINRNYTKLGEVVTVRWNTSVLFDPSGAPSHILSLASDLTKPLANEAKIHLERLSAFGAMAAAIVHEINSPLTTITLRAELVERMAQSGDLRQEALTAESRTIANTAIHIGDLIRDLRKVSDGIKNGSSQGCV